MARFQVPQFIEQEAKIVGPLTLQQFLYVASAAVVALLAYYLLPVALWLIVALLAAGVGLALAFLKINGQDLPTIVWSAINYWQKPQVYVWKRETEFEMLDVPQVKKIESERRSMGLQEKIRSAAFKVATGAKPFLEKDKKQEEKLQAVRYATGEQRLAKRVDYKED